MKKLKSFGEFINEWFITKTTEGPITREEMERFLGGRSKISLEYDANRIKALLWLYFLSIGQGRNDGFGFDRMDQEYWSTIAAKVITHGRLLPMEMELLRPKIYYYSHQLTKIANYERLKGKDPEIEKYVDRWIRDNESKYKVEEKPLPPELPKQGSLF